MNKRDFFGAALLAAGALPAAGAAVSSPPGPALLTVTGALRRRNRGPFDPVADQLMHKQKRSFDMAYTFDFAALLRLPAQDIRPTLEYDARAHALRGPLLTEVVAAAGGGASGNLLLRAIDGYAVTLTLAEARARRFIVATHLNGKPMALGGLGPLWAIYDADRVPDMAARPLGERFANCPWALYHIEVMA